MIYFHPLRTKRIAVALREITLGESMRLCGIASDRQELCTTEFLRVAAEKAERPQPQYVTDPALWTVQERARVLAHYLAQVNDEGMDFSIGDAVISDYLVFDRDMRVDEVSIGKIGDAEYVMGHLLGEHVEVLEAMCRSRGEWMLGAMAMQVRKAGEAALSISAMPDAQKIEHVSARMEAIKALPESEFEVMLAAYWAGSNELAHFFQMNFSDDGVVFESTEAGNKPPARFPAHACLGAATRSLFGVAAKPRS